MNFSLLWSMALLALKKTPDAALDVMNRLRPENWKMSCDGVTASAVRPRFNVIESARKRKLAMELSYVVDGVQHTLHGASRFRNDGSDELSIDGVSVVMPARGYDLTSKALRGHVEILMPYIGADGAAHEIKLWNNF